MPFLGKEDYKSQIKQDVLDVVLNNDDTIRTKAELAAQAEMESYLRQRFDVAQIFNKTGENRHPLVLMYLIDITLFHLHSGVNSRVMPEIREVRYNQAVEWLKAVSKGSVSPDLPAYATEETTKATAGTIWSSWAKTQNYY